MNDVPFPQRFGVVGKKLVDKDFPESARNGLSYLLTRLIEKEYIDVDDMFEEILRTGRFNRIAINKKREYFDQFLENLNALPWHQVFVFCERAYLLLKYVQRFDNDLNYWVVAVTIEEVEEYYHQELNNLLKEENIAFRFVNGHFERTGHAQTQKNLMRVGTVLSDPRLSSVRIHFNKAQRYYDAIQDVDYQNSIKEAVCALEAMISILTNNKYASDFPKAAKELMGNDDKKIPPPIGEIMIKLYAYRGSGQGVAHAALKGNRVGQNEAELTLSVSASLITYLYSFLPDDDDIPF